MPTSAFRPQATALEGREVPALAFGDLFNSQQYLADNPDVRGAGADAATHFRQFGQREGRDPGRLFDVSDYLTANPDVRAAGVNPLDHFLRNGQFEGRNPSNLFNTAAYLAANPDVAAAVRAGGLSAYEHFLRSGQFEDRSPGNGFDLGVYLDDNPDVRDAVERGLIGGTQHFVSFGYREGRGKPISRVLTLPPGQPAVSFTGTSADSDDKQFSAIRVPQTRTVRVTVERLSGDFVNVEIENARTDVDVLELEPKNGVNTGVVTLERGELYLLRVRAVDDVAASYRVTITPA